ncbi:MAG: hypothetical protein PHI44_00530 [Candidatus Ratteibacteria bacterium]|nr:hypothetical protein [Candidatus Ratteibacteria bacterium]
MRFNKDAFFEKCREDRLYELLEKFRQKRLNRRIKKFVEYIKNA